MMRVTRLIIALVALAALTAQFLHSGINNPLHFFSFFTILSNILATFCLLIFAAFPSSASPTRENIHTATTLYMMMTGSIYWIFLRNVDTGPLLPWANLILHGLLPAYFLVDWLIHKPAAKLYFAAPALWLLFPFCFFIYSQILGHITEWYPYPFFNPEKMRGAWHVVEFGSTLLLFTWVTGLLLVCLNRCKLKLQK